MLGKPNLDGIARMSVDVNVSDSWNHYTITSTNRVIDFTDDGYDCSYALACDEDFVARSAQASATAAAFTLAGADGYGCPLAGGYKKNIITMDYNHRFLAVKTISGATAVLYTKKVGV